MRHLKGETQVALRKEFCVGKSTLKLWKQLFIQAGTARLSGYIESNPDLVTRLRRLIAEAAESVKDWEPDFEKLI